MIYKILFSLGFSVPLIVRWHRSEWSFFHYEVPLMYLVATLCLGIFHGFSFYNKSDSEVRVKKIGMLLKYCFLSSALSLPIALNAGFNKFALLIFAFFWASTVLLVILCCKAEKGGIGTAIGYLCFGIAIGAGAKYGVTQYGYRFHVILNQRHELNILFNIVGAASMLKSCLRYAELLKPQKS